MEQGNNLTQGQGVIAGQPTGQTHSVAGDPVLRRQDPGDIPQPDPVDFPNVRRQTAHSHDEARHFPPSAEGNHHQITRLKTGLFARALFRLESVGEHLGQGHGQNDFNKLAQGSLKPHWGVHR